MSNITKVQHKRSLEEKIALNKLYGHFTKEQILDSVVIYKIQTRGAVEANINYHHAMKVLNDFQ